MSIFEEIKDKVKSSISSVKTTVFAVVSSVRNFLGELYGSVVFALDEGYEQSEAYDEQMIGSCQNIVIDTLGENPLNKIVNLSPEERAYALQQIISKTASLLNVDINQIVIDDLKGLYGYYNDKNKTIAINIEQIVEEPMTIESAKELLITVFHELRHAYQHYAARNPSQYGADKLTASIWRTNYKNYVQCSKNPKRYYIQPVEQDARNFALSVLNTFNS